ncbi:MAG: hypothetical protein HY521_02490, partial [Proteobacteria bacterium]|nr:hypothetical protein [Pseudomonadota bacterium]
MHCPNRGPGPGGRSARRATARAGLAALSALFLAACAYRGESDNPIIRRLTWFSYLNGDDVRAACRPGARERYRFVYNADYTQQVRTYEVVASPWRDGNALEVRVLTPADLARGLKLDDPLELWRGTSALVAVSDLDLAILKEALAAGGFGAPEVGLRLPSRATYWVVIACRAGGYAFDAYLHPSTRFQGLRFPAELARLDPTGIPPRPPPP